MSYHLKKREGVYYFRRRIPKDLIPHYEGKREVNRGLGVKDRAVAERLVRKIDVEFDDQWQPLPLRLATLLELCPLSRDALSVDEMGDPDVSMVRRQSVIAYRDRLLAEGKATETINTRLSFIRILLGIAKDRGFVEVNHADDTALAEDKRLWSCIRRSSPARYELGFP